MTKTVAEAEPMSAAISAAGIAAEAAAAGITAVQAIAKM
jgi:hypothetical protein